MVNDVTDVCIAADVMNTVWSYFLVSVLKDISVLSYSSKIALLAVSIKTWLKSYKLINHCSLLLISQMCSCRACINSWICGSWVIGLVILLYGSLRGCRVFTDDFKVSGLAIKCYSEYYGPKPSKDQRSRVKLDNAVHKGTPITATTFLILHGMHAGIWA